MLVSVPSPGLEPIPFYTLYSRFIAGLGVKLGEVWSVFVSLFVSGFNTNLFASL